MRNCRFDRLAQKNADMISLSHAVAPERMRNAVRAALQYIERITFDAAVPRLLNDCKTPAAIGPPVARVDADVVSRGNASFETGRCLLVAVETIQREAPEYCSPEV